MSANTSSLTASKSRPTNSAITRITPITPVTNSPLTRLTSPAALLACLFVSSCALLGKSDLVVPRYFTPMAEITIGAPATTAAQSDLQLRLGRVEGLSHLRERIVQRNAPTELTYYEDRRWTERPEVYLRRALSQTFFTERGVTEVISGNAITLEVEMVAFEEVLQPTRVGRMQASFVLRDARLALLEQTVTVEVPIGNGSDPAVALVDALSQALHKGTEQIADIVVAKLGALKH